MFKSYLRIAVRNLKRRKLYTSINIFGLAVGLAMCFITIGHLSYELSFEDMHEKKDRIYRVNVRYQSEDREFYTAHSMPALGHALKEEIPEIEKVALFKVLGNVNLKVGEEQFIPERQFSTHGYEHGGNVICANPDFLDVFTFPLVAGDPLTVLSEPYSIIITERAAKEHFHGLYPIGQTVQIHDSLHCQVTGIMEDMSENTQLYCDFIISHSTLERMGHDVSSWDQIKDDYAYLLLEEGADWSSVEQKIPGIVSSHLEPDEFEKYEFELQKLKSIYFYAYEAGRRGNLHPNGEASMMWTLGLVALFVLLLAIANFVNLSTARSADRMREVGVRKVFGAFRSNLVKQFLGESFIITTVAFLIGLVIYEVFKHSIQGSLPREAFADFYTNGLMLYLIIGLLVVVGVLAGYYPALYLSRFRPIAILQSKSSVKSSKSFLRKALVVFQFTIAIGFVCCSTIVSKQMSFIQSIDVGFARENVLVLDFEGEDAADNCMLMKNEVLSNNRVLSATVSNSPPGRRDWHLWGIYTDEERENMETMWTYTTDYDFISTFDLTIVDGRGFSEESGSDDRHSIILNETTVRELGIQEPIGHILYGGEESSYRIVGVVKDFHGSPLDWAYHPYSCIMLRPDLAHTLSIVLPPDDIAGSLAAIEETWNATLPGEAFSYSFLDEEIRNNYDSDSGPNAMMKVLSVLTTLIACLGVLALVSFTAEQRTKEIGIRKVLGASVSGVVMLLSKEFIILIAIANAIAWPFAYWVMSQFLNEFAFRISIGIGTFLFTALVAIVAAMFAASFQAIKAATANPTDALQHE